MPRPAKPGDVGILIGDPLAGGYNIGKRVYVMAQCVCKVDFWQLKPLEPMLFRPPSFNVVIRPAALRELCLAKKHVIVLEDPDTPEAITASTYRNNHAPDTST